MRNLNRTVFPLFSDQSAEAGCLTLDKALERKCSVITEVSEGRSVPELKFVNSGSLPVFLLGGEELIEAKQNRVINISILVAAGKTLVIPVSCVEAVRWSHWSRHFASAPRVHYAEGEQKNGAGERAHARHRAAQVRPVGDLAGYQRKSRGPLRVLGDIGDKRHFRAGSGAAEPFSLLILEDACVYVQLQPVDLVHQKLRFTGAGHLPVMEKVVAYHPKFLPERLSHSTRGTVVRDCFDYLLQRHVRIDLLEMIKVGQLADLRLEAVACDQNRKEMRFKRKDAREAM